MEKLSKSVNYIHHTACTDDASRWDRLILNAADLAVAAVARAEEKNTECGGALFTTGTGPGMHGQWWRLSRCPGKSHHAQAFTQAQRPKGPDLGSPSLLEIDTTLGSFLSRYGVQVNPNRLDTK